MKGSTGCTFFLVLCLAMGCADTSGQRIDGEMPDPRSGIFVEKCTDCHNLDKVEAARGVKTRAEMREILKRQKDMEGSGLTDQDLEALLAGSVRSLTDQVFSASSLSFAFRVDTR